MPSTVVIFDLELFSVTGRVTQAGGLVTKHGAIVTGKLEKHQHDGKQRGTQRVR